ncbi:MAG: histidine kinase [Opitutae bacterium]|nr:histidine kinase [Opitutae bacterium]
MAVPTAVSAFVRPDVLAVPPAGVVRSRPAMNTAAETQARLQRAKERLYVLCQVGGWGVFLSLQFVFVQAFSDRTRAREDFGRYGQFVLVVLTGLLLTHFVRPVMHRWGWKELSWRALIPRVLMMGVTLSFLWVSFGYGYTYGVLREPWPPKSSPQLIFLVTWINGSIMMIGWLCFYFFYHTFERLNRLQFEQLRLVANLREAELRALKSQVNPHFLFNSLNSLRALIDEDAPRARESVTRLANMLRYSLQSGQLATVPFEDELRIVEDYLALEQIRHESRLTVRWQISELARPLAVPPMLLQTLVENAVKYGISSRREGGELVISAHYDAPAAAQPGALHIRVTNPGDLNAPATQSAARAGSSTGVGLRNASERLKLLFGDQAVLCLLAEPAGFVTADVRIPIKNTAA